MVDQHHRNEKLFIRSYQYVAMLREVQTIEMTRFPDQHFGTQVTTRPGRVESAA